MADMTHIKAGATVYVVESRDSFRQGSLDRIIGMEVVAKVGRDYFYTGEGHMQRKFRRDTGREAGDFVSGRAFVDEAAYHAATVREARERTVESNMPRYGRRHWERLTDGELDDLLGLLEKLNGISAGAEP